MNKSPETNVKLYFVATPIGNLGDLSYRAAETLAAVDVIACEDTRHSLPLLNKYGIKKQLIACHKFNERASCDKLLALIDEGKTVALITDAGTPVISDPGNILVNALNEKGVGYTLIPGACALTGALVLSGFDALRFVFLGFLPEKAGECASLLERYSGVDATLIFYCAPHDVRVTVERLYSALGDRKACAVREMTKMFESVERFNLGGGYPFEPRGEYVLVVEGATGATDFSALSIEDHVRMYINGGMSKNDAVKQTAKDRGVAKNEIYMRVLNI